jgi:putative endonuclease
MKNCVYILKDDNDLFYIGSTVDLAQRLTRHYNGHTQTTNRMKNPILVLAQEYNSLATARNVERKIKKLKRKDYIEKMVKEGYIKLV